MCRACRWSMPTIALSVSSPGTTCCARSVVCRALQATAVESAFRRDPDQAGHTSAAAIAPVRKEATGIAYGAVFAAMDLEHTQRVQALPTQAEQIAQPMHGPHRTEGLHGAGRGAHAQRQSA